MTPRVKLWSVCGAVVVALSVAAMLVVRSDWFSGIVRDKIASEAGRVTGGPPWAWDEPRTIGPAKQ